MSTVRHWSLVGLLVRREMLPLLMPYLHTSFFSSSNPSSTFLIPALSPWQILNSQRVLKIFRQQNTEVEKKPLRMATVNVGSLRGRGEERRLQK